MTTPTALPFNGDRVAKRNGSESRTEGLLNMNVIEAQPNAEQSRNRPHLSRPLAHQPAAPRLPENDTAGLQAFASSISLDAREDAATYVHRANTHHDGE